MGAATYRPVAAFAAGVWAWASASFGDLRSFLLCAWLGWRLAHFPNALIFNLRIDLPTLNLGIRTMKPLLLAALLLVMQPAHSGDFNYAAYEDSSLSAPGSDLHIPAKADWLAVGYMKFHTVAVSTGNIKPLQADSKSLIQRWAAANHQSKTMADVFVSEVEISQGGVNYWLPIQKEL